MALPNALDFAEMQANSKKVQAWKDRIEKNMLLLIENNSQDRNIAFDYIPVEDNNIIDKYIIPWLTDLKYKAYRRDGWSGHDGDYNSLVISW